MSVAHFASGAGVARRTTAQRTAMVPTRNSLIYDTDALDLYVGDGTTIGGQPAPGSGAPVTGVIHSVGNIAESADGKKTFNGGVVLPYDPSQVGNDLRWLDSTGGMLMNMVSVAGNSLDIHAGANLAALHVFAGASSVLTVIPSGYVGTNIYSPQGGFHAVAPYAATPALIAEGVSGQAAHLFEARVNGVILSCMTNDGRLIVGGTIDQNMGLMATHPSNPNIGLYNTGQGVVHAWFAEVGVNTFLNNNPITHRAVSYTFSNVPQTTNWMRIDTGGHVVVGNQGTAGLSDAQFESHAKDSMTPIFAGYTSLGGYPAILSDAAGRFHVGYDPSNAFPSAANILGLPNIDNGAREILSVYDKSAMAIGVGGGIVFGGFYTADGGYATFANIQGVKADGADGNWGGNLEFYTRNSPHGSMVKQLTIADSGTATFGGPAIVKSLTTNAGSGNSSFTDIEINNGTTGLSGTEAHGIDWTVGIGTKTTMVRIETEFVGAGIGLYFRNFYQSGAHSNILFGFLGTGQMVVGNSGVPGLANAQLEVKASDSSPSIFAGYLSTGGAAVIEVTPQGWLSVGAGASAFGTFPVFVAGAANRNDVVPFNTDTGGMVRYGINNSFGYLFTASNHPLTFGTANNVNQLTIDTTGHVYINGSGAGLAGAQFEVHAKDSVTPIFAGYNYLGGTAAFQVGPDGRTTITTSVPGGLSIQDTSGGASMVRLVGGVKTIGLRCQINDGDSFWIRNETDGINYVVINTIGQVFVNQSSAGSANAQFEVHSKDGTTPIFAGYTSAGGDAPIRILPDGTILCKPLTTNSPGITFYANNYGLGVDTANLTIFSSLGFAFKNSSVTGSTVALLNGNGQMALGNGGLFGLANAQLESHSKDALTPIFAGYTYLGASAFLVDGDGNTTIGTGTGPSSTQGLLVNYGANSLILSQGSSNPGVMALSTTGNISTKIQSIGSISAGVIGTQSNHNLWIETNNTARVVIDTNGLTETIGGITSKGGGHVSSNEAFGYGALQYNTTGIYSTAVGNSALQNQTTGTLNTAVGTAAMLQTTTGQKNVAVGASALQRATIAENNVAVGYSAGAAVTDSVNMTAIGYLALTSITSGSGNCTALGVESDFLKTAGGETTALGAFTRTGSYTHSTALGANATCTADNQIMLGTATETVTTLGPVVITGGYLALGPPQLGSQSQSAGNIYLPGNANYLSLHPFGDSAGYYVGNSFSNTRLQVASDPVGHRAVEIGYTNDDTWTGVFHQSFYVDGYDGTTRIGLPSGPGLAGAQFEVKAKDNMTPIFAGYNSLGQHCAGIDSLGRLAAYNPANDVYGGYLWADLNSTYFTSQNTNIALQSAGSFILTYAAPYTTVAFGVSGVNLDQTVGTNQTLAQFAGTFAHNSGAFNLTGLSIPITIYQTGTASGSYTGILCNVTELAVLGTNNKLLDLQIGGVSKFAVTNLGVPIFPAVPEASISNGGIAWSTDNPGHLMARKPDGTLKEIQLI